MALDRTFWAGRRVFVTGHTGFKGSWLLLMLDALGAKVTGYSLAPPTDPALFDMLKLDQLCDHHVGDIRDLSAMESALAAAAPDIVIHMAAQPLVRASYAMPVETYATNVMGTVNLMDACRRVPSVKTIVVVTTDKCYENLGVSRGYDESDRMGGHDPYSNSKACAELAVAAYRDSFMREGGIGLASARAGNVIGGGDFAEDRLVPDAARAFSAGEALSIRNPLAIRPWQHVLEPLYGYLLLAERTHGDATVFAQGWNFGPAVGDAASVETVVDYLAKMWGDGARWVQDPGSHPHEAATLMLDCAKAQSELGWVPRFNLEQALQLSIDWYRCWHEKDDVGALCKQHVNQYLSHIGA
jgi:CDP-glucose 4,6-dehydratase